MAEIIPFPVKLIPPRAGNSTEKSDFQQVIDKLIIATKSHGRSQGFMIGILVANIQHIIVQYFIK
jgi:hypothetical protein